MPASDPCAASVGFQLKAARPFDSDDFGSNNLSPLAHMQVEDDCKDVRFLLSDWEPLDEIWLLACSNRFFFNTDPSFRRFRWVNLSRLKPLIAL